MSSQSTGLKRTTVDKYYTSPDIVNTCMNFIKETININDNDICIEPSAGNGSFIPSIKNTFNNYKFYDLKPENNDIIEQDYLEYDYSSLSTYNKIHIVGNPPFGRQSNIAVKFIKYSCKFANSISFILPKSFKKDSYKNKIPLNFHLVKEYDLPYNSFMVDNIPYDVPCVFQIWIKKDIDRIKPIKLIPNKFTFVSKNDNFHISFRRIGFYAGKINKSDVDKTASTHYFIKFIEPFTDELFNSLSNINFDCRNNTVGAKSISKQEVIKEFNSIMS